MGITIDDEDMDLGKNWKANELYQAAPAGLPVKGSQTHINPSRSASPSHSPQNSSGHRVQNINSAGSAYVPMSDAGSSQAESTSHNMLSTGSSHYVPMSEPESTTASEHGGGPSYVNLHSSFKMKKVPTPESQNSNTPNPYTDLSQDMVNNPLSDQEDTPTKNKDENASGGNKNLRVHMGIEASRISSEYFEVGPDIEDHEVNDGRLG